MQLNRLIVYSLFALSGFSALIYELLWTKYISLTFGTTMAAVSTVAATFMAGLAPGQPPVRTTLRPECPPLKLPLKNFGTSPTERAAVFRSLADRFYHAGRHWLKRCV